jgi:hypothetical protein
MKYFFVLILGILFVPTYAQTMKIPFETSNGQKTSTYFETIQFWEDLDRKSDLIQMETKGLTDSGYPMHLIIISNSKEFDFKKNHQNNKTILLINNGIHPGEPDGIDASMLMARDIADKKLIISDDIVVVIIPVFNVGGMLNRSPNYRVDQNGPDEFGSRGNAQNLDLNRDFIKLDSKNNRSFAQIFQEIQPDIFIDNHVSNGADYQHVMTLLTSQHHKIGGEMGVYMNQVFEPELYKTMKSKGFPMIPYVNVWGTTPDNGWNEFLDSPRYSSGFATLFHTFSFVPETHMLKSYSQRVDATYAFMASVIEFAQKNGSQIKKLRLNTIEKSKTEKEFPINWKHNPEKFQEFEFLGFESGYKKSEVSGRDRLYYDRTKPYNKQIPLYNHFDVQTSIEKPIAYIIPQGWWKIIEILKLNGVEMKPLTSDQEMEVEVYHILSLKSSESAYEGHHINQNVEVKKSSQKISFRKGDWYIPMNQKANRYLMETLEPEGMDSFFAWNFFDSILQQKEWFSAYAFEDIAAEYLNENPEVRAKLEEKKKEDSEFAQDGSAQLIWVYQNSPWVEPEFMRYPVYRILK